MLVEGARRAVPSQLESLMSDPSLPAMLPDPAAAPPEVRRRVWTRPLALLALFASLVVLAQLTDLPARLSAAEIRGWTGRFGLWTPLVVVAVYLLRPLVLLPITPFWIATGTVFGPLEGAAWAVVGTSLGAALGFGLARRLGREFVEQRFGRRVRRWATLPGRQGMSTVLALQLTPIMPHDLINNLAGLSRMPYRSFFLGSLLGTIPVILVYAYVGSAVLEVGSPRFWLAAALLTGMTITMLAWNRRLARQAAVQPHNAGGDDARATAHDPDGGGAGAAGGLSRGG